MSTVSAGILDGIQRGTLAAVLHVAAANASASREIVTEFNAATAAVKSYSQRFLSSSTVAIAFANGLSRDHLVRMVCEGRTQHRLLEEVRAASLLASTLGETELDRYRRVVIEAAERAACEVKESEFFSRRWTTRSEAAAINEIKDALTAGLPLRCANAVAATV